MTCKSVTPLLIRCLLVTVTAMNSFVAQATGMLPDTPLLVISEADGTAQMGLRNTDNEPLLLHTTIIDLPGPAGPAVYALPPVARVEANGRQVVRFILEKTAEPLKVQQLKRVSFEGIPTRKPGSQDTNTVQLTVAQVLPVIISPKGLEQDPEPWKNITWKLVDGQFVIANLSPFGARLSQEVVLLPMGKSVRLLPRPYVLPGETFTVAMPPDVIAPVTALRMQPASPYGFSVAPVEVALQRSALTPPDIT